MNKNKKAEEREGDIGTGGEKDDKETRKKINVVLFTAVFSAIGTPKIE